MKLKSSLYLFIFILFLLNATVSSAQLSAPGSSSTEETNYPAFTENDSIFIFCTEDSLSSVGELRVQTALEGTKTFLWEKYNNLSAGFEFYFSESTEAQQSTISSLDDGGYRVTVTQGETTEFYRAWVFNNWNAASGYVSNSNCTSFKLNGTAASAILTYYDLLDNTAIDLFKDVKVQWKEGETTVASVISPQIFSPPTKNTEYTLRVYDRFGCEATTDVMYKSVVIEAKFSVDFGDQSADNLEAPLTVIFTNESENASPDQYEWFFFHDLDDIKRESEGTDQPVDSIMVVAYDINPVYTYENTGTYNVKLVAKHVSDTLVCVDTTYIDDYIVVDTSFVRAPNVFNPDRNPPNNEFIVKFFSMQSVKISVFNRWGKRVHFWERKNIQGFDSAREESVWDGTIGGRKASPGVYYYVVEGVGRDDKNRWAHGFVHLFRDN